MNEIKEYTERLFEDIKHIDEKENEYWLARDLQKVLEYKDWRNFGKTINKSIISANTSYPNQNLLGVEVTIPINSDRVKLCKKKWINYIHIFLIAA